MDMKKILQAMDSASTKPVEGTNDMSKFLSIVRKNDVKILNEGANPHKVSLPVQMAMQHYQQPAVKPAPRTRLIDKYFTEAEANILQKQQEKKAILKQYSQVIAERVLMKEANATPAQTQNLFSIQGEGLETNIVVNGIEIYGVKDFLVDLAISAAILTLGTLLAPPSGGSSAMITAAALANPVRRVFTYVIRYAQYVFKTQTLTKEALSAWVKSRYDIFLKLLRETLAPVALKATVAGTAMFNTVVGVLEKYDLLPDWAKKDKPLDPANPEASVKLK